MDGNIEGILSLQSMDPSSLVGVERTLYHEEARRLLFERPLKTRLDFPSALAPTSSMTTTGTQSITTLDCLPSPIRVLHNRSTPPWTRSSASWIGLSPNIRECSTPNERVSTVLDGLLQTLWNDYLATQEDLERLENIVATHSNADQLLHQAWCSTSSSFPNTRVSGYSLLELICKHHYPLSEIQRHCVWISICACGIERDEQSRRKQMSALATLVGPHGDIMGLGGMLTQILGWIYESITHPDMKDFTTLTECHDIIKTIGIGHLEDAQIHEIISVYCDIVSRALDQSEQNTSLCSQDPAITRIVSFWLEIIELVLDQVLIPDSAINVLINTLCLVLGCGGESKPNALGKLSQIFEDPLDEAYKLAAHLALRLLSDQLYRIPVLDILEGVLGYSTDQPILVRIGAVNVVCERVWSGLAACSKPFPCGGAEGQQQGNLASFEDELLILQTSPDQWIERAGSDPLFTRVLTGAGQIVQKFEFKLCLSVRNFVSMTIARISVLLNRFNNPDGSPYQLMVSQTSENANCFSPTLLGEIEALLATVLGLARIPPFLSYAFLTMSSHLPDPHLLVFVNASREQLSPVHDDWAQYFRLYMEMYRRTAGRSLASRRAIISSIEDHHSDIVDTSVCHDEIKEELVLLLEQTLPEEHDEHIIRSAFHILARELVSIISGKYSSPQLHFHLSQICNGWIRLATSECTCTPSVQTNTAASSKINATRLIPTSCHSSRQALAVNFLVHALNKMMFASIGIRSAYPGDSAPHQPPASSTFYVHLFDTLLDLISADGSRMGKPHISCVKARLALLRWMMRLRADSEHRVFIAVGDIPELLSLAQMTQRADTSAAPFWIHNDVDLELKSRIQASRKRAGSSRSPQKQRPNSVGGTPVLPTMKEGPIDSVEKRENQQLFYWRLPDVLTNLDEEMTRPSHLISTSAGESGDRGIKLPVNIYLSTITEIIVHSWDWEIVSYILCHLPIQLSNKRLFYGRDTNTSMRQLIVAICVSIKDDELYHRMSNMNPPDLPESAVRAVLYECLTVLLGYHNRLEPFGSLRDKEPNFNSIIVDSLVQGLSGGMRARRPCLEALSLAAYRVPNEIARRGALIVEKLTSFATNQFDAPRILEYLIIVGYTPKLHVGIFQDDDYCRVFGLALMYIQHYSRPDAQTITKLDGKESYALAQHVYRMSFMIFYVWFVAMKLVDRAKFVPFIVNGLQDAIGKSGMVDSSIEVCLDWLVQNTYGNADPVPWSWFMYSSIAFPGYGSRSIPSNRQERREAQRENVAEVKAWKLGNAIMLVSIMKQPVGWARVVVHRPAGRMELFCHIEKVRRSSPLEDFGDDGNTPSIPLSRYEGAVRSLVMPLLFNGSEPYDTSNLRAYTDVAQLQQTLNYLHHTPVVTPHQVGVLYVAPGQTKEENILSNTHGSLTYAHFLSRLTQVVDLSSIDEKVFARGLQMKLHGKYTRAWMDDIAAINFHVATMMPNIGDNMSKKGPIGNDAVKIIWNDSGQPYDFKTFKSAFNLINIVIEPQSPALTSAYRTSLDGFLKITLQAAPGMPRPTPIGDFKMVQLEYLPVMMRHFSLFACLLCESWTGTGCDGMERNPLETNWEARLACIERSEKYLEPERAQNGR